MRTAPLRRSALVACLFAVGLLSIPWFGSAWAQPRTPTQVRVVGFAESAPEGTASRATWRLAFSGTEKAFVVVQLVVLSPGAATSGQILSQMRAQRGSVQVVGSEAQLQSLTDAKAGAPLSITGNLRWSSGRPSLLISEVDAAADS